MRSLSTSEVELERSINQMKTALYDVTEDCYKGPVTGALYPPSDYKAARFIYSTVAISENHVFLALQKVVLDGDIPPHNNLFLR